MLQIENGMKKNSPEIEAQLRQHGLKITTIRTQVLDIFHKSSSSISQQTIEKKMDHPDRVTIYRTLRDMESSGIIHKVLSAKGETKFALCAEHCTDHAHQDNHIHFTCTKCEETYCLTDHKPRSISLPEGFVIGEVQVIVSGVCEKCAA